MSSDKTAEAWKRVEHVFLEVASATPAERESRLRTLCGDDAALRAEVEELLGAAETVGNEPPDELGPMPAAKRLLESLRDYIIIGRLGDGAQGIVYRAIDRRTKREVVIKMLRAGRHASLAERRRFHREVELLARLRHPHIVSVLRSDETDDGAPFYVMDYVPGTRLDRHVREHRLPLADVLRLFAKICRAVQCAHQNGIIHRDLKPSNILVTADGEPCLVDFGLARMLSEPADQRVSVTQQLLGTIPYMAPEQVRGRNDEVDTRTDVYALGVVLYELLTGDLPHRPSDNITDRLRSIADGEPIRPRRRWRAARGLARDGRRRLWQRACPIDHDLETIVMTCLQKARDRRYQSAGELARDLDRYVAGEPLATRGPNLLYLLRKRLWRHRVAAAVVLVVVGLVTAAGYYRMRAAAYGRRHAAVLVREARLMGMLDTAGALAHLEQAIAASPDWPKPQIQRAYLLSRIGEEAAARTAAETLVQRFPERGEPHVLLAALTEESGAADRHMQQARALLPHEAAYYRALAMPVAESEAALALLDESLAAFPWNFEALVERAMRYHDLGRYEEMLGDAKLLVRVGRDLSLPWGLQGTALLNLAGAAGRQGEWEERAALLDRALASFDRAIESAGSAWPWHYNRALARYGVGDLAGAVADARHVTVRHPHFPDAWVLLADVLFSRGDCAGALDAYSSWAELSDSPIAFHRRALAQLACGRPAAAEDDLRAAIARDQAFGMAYHDLGNLLLMKGAWSAAAAAHERSYRLDADDPFAQLGHGIGRWCTGDHAGAVAAFEAVLAAEHAPSEDVAAKQEADFASVYFWIHEIRRDRGDVEAAEAALDAALRVADDRLGAIAAHFRGQVSADDVLGLCESAVEDCEAYYYLGTAARLSGLTDDARVLFNHCIDTNATHCLEYFLAHRQLKLMNGSTPVQD